MSKAKGAGSAFGKVLTYILVVLLLLGIVGGVAYFFMRSQGVTYYVEYNDTQYLANSDGGSIGLRTGETHEFSVKSLTGEEVNYSVKVISNEANNFSFSIGDELHRFYEGNDANDDYSSLFGLQKSADGFTITIPNNVTVESIVSEKFGGEIELLSELSDEYSYFVVVVSSGDSVVNLWFTLDGNVTGITLDTTHIIFGGDTIVSDNPPSETLSAEETFIRYMVQAAQAQSYEEVQPILGAIHQLYTDLVVGGEFSGNSDVRTALSAYVALFRAVEDREYTADEAASVREDLGDLMERYEPME